MVRCNVSNNQPGPVKGSLASARGKVPPLAAVALYEHNNQPIVTVGNQPYPGTVLTSELWV